MMAFRILFLAAVFTGTVLAQNPPERTRLYTKTDPANSGGLKGHIAKPEIPIEEILALPTDNLEEVYEGQISGAKRDTFEFKNLPVGKFDLIAVYPVAFYEGFQLNRDASTLTREDLAKIDVTVQKSEPYWTKKIVHRVEGVTGRASEARAIITFARDRGSDLLMETFQGKSSRPDFRRTFKLVLLKDVGPGWQIVRARDLYPVWIDPKHLLPEHHFSTALNQLRVADEVKDLGSLDLTH
jgi:hypothetical protein